MKIYNSYTNRLEQFVPRHEGIISMYVCGPTVYNYIHIGNARPVVIFDVVRRFFEAKGNLVRFASNFTDVDDKIIQKAMDEHKTELEVANHYIQAFLADLTSLNCKVDYIKPRVTEYMDEIIDYIKWLLDNGFAYEIEGDVYFRVSKIAEYGHLSNRKLDDLISGARVEINLKKESPLDFTLWKATTEGVNWKSPFSTGRPGWHTECVAMIDKIFGEEIDIHGGGSDLLFPHHENEIAQSIAHHDHLVAKYWMHNGRLNLEGEKMSKSLGNVIFVKDLPKERTGFRMFLLGTHYRSPLNFNPESLATYDSEWAKLAKTVQTLYRSLELAGELHPNTPVTDVAIRETLSTFDEALEADFNTPNALTALATLTKLMNQFQRQKNAYALQNQTYAAMIYMLNILGLDPKIKPLANSEIELIRSWEAARNAKDFAKADLLRTELVAKGLL